MVGSSFINTIFSYFVAVGSTYYFVSFNASVQQTLIEKMLQPKFIQTWHVMSRLEKQMIKRYLGVTYLFLSWTIKRLRA